MPLSNMTPFSSEDLQELWNYMALSDDSLNPEGNSTQQSRETPPSNNNEPLEVTCTADQAVFMARRATNLVDNPFWQSQFMQNTEGFNGLNGCFNAILETQQRLYTPNVATQPAQCPLMVDRSAINVSTSFTQADQGSRTGRKVAQTHRFEHYAAPSAPERGLSHESMQQREAKRKLESRKQSRWMWETESPSRDQRNRLTSGELLVKRPPPGYKPPRRLGDRGAVEYVGQHPFQMAVNLSQLEADRLGLSTRRRPRPATVHAPAGVNGGLVNFAGPYPMQWQAPISRSNGSTKCPSGLNNNMGASNLVSQTPQPGFMEAPFPEVNAMDFSTPFQFQNGTQMECLWSFNTGEYSQVDDCMTMTSDSIQSDASATEGASIFPATTQEGFNMHSGLLSGSGSQACTMKSVQLSDSVDNIQETGPELESYQNQSRHAEPKIDIIPDLSELMGNEESAGIEPLGSSVIEDTTNEAAVTDSSTVTQLVQDLGPLLPVDLPCSAASSHPTTASPGNKAETSTDPQSGDTLDANLTTAVPDLVPDMYQIGDLDLDYQEAQMLMLESADEPLFPSDGTAAPWDTTMWDNSVFDTLDKNILDDDWLENL